MRGFVTLLLIPGWEGVFDARRLAHRLAIQKRRPFLWFAPMQGVESEQDLGRLAAKGLLHTGSAGRAGNSADWPGAKSNVPDPPREQRVPDQGCRRLRAAPSSPHPPCVPRCRGAASVTYDNEQASIRQASSTAQPRGVETICLCKRNTRGPLRIRILLASICPAAAGRKEAIENKEQIQSNNPVSNPA